MAGRDLRLQVPEVETPDLLVDQLAQRARDSRTTPARPRRISAYVAAAVAAVLLSAGGAWATGVVTVPGLPLPDVLRPDAPTPSTPPAPSGSDSEGPGSEGPGSEPGDRPTSGVEEDADRAPDETESGDPRERRPDGGPGAEGEPPMSPPRGSGQGEDRNDSQGRENQGRESQGRENQGRGSQGRENQGRGSQGRESQGRESQGRESQGRESKRDVGGGAERSRVTPRGPGVDRHHRAADLT